MAVLLAGGIYYKCGSWDIVIVGANGDDQRISSCPMTTSWATFHAISSSPIGSQIDFLMPTRSGRDLLQAMDTLMRSDDRPDGLALAVYEQTVRGISPVAPVVALAWREY